MAIGSRTTMNPREAPVHATSAVSPAAYAASRLSPGCHRHCIPAARTGPDETPLVRGQIRPLTCDDASPRGTSTDDSKPGKPLGHATHNLKSNRLREGGDEIVSPCARHQLLESPSGHDDSAAELKARQVAAADQFVR